ncbi:MAG: peptidylprolyl isomerase [Firmicutes bacterium]|nr:peptidylprolyl isomerase [Bacillota bacterium]
MANNKRSLTSKERRELNNPKPPPPKEEQADKPKRKKLVIFFSVLCLGLALIIAGVSIGIYFSVREPRFNTDNPVARIYLEIDGNRRVHIDVELFPDDAPNAVANFIFLVETGFYDGTIISDVGGVEDGTPASGHGFMRFAGFVNPVDNRANPTVDPAFHSSFPLLRDDRTNNRLAYNLGTAGDNTTFRGRYQEPYMMSLIQSGGWGPNLGRTAVQIGTIQNPDTRLEHRNSTGVRTYTGHAFGQVMYDSRQLVREIAQMNFQEEFLTGYSHNFFRHPVAADGRTSRVVIRRIRVYQQGDLRMNMNDRVTDMQGRTTASWLENPSTTWL